MVMGEDLLAIYAEAADERRAEQAQRPAACPNDGTPLEAGPRGELHCRFDGWRWPDNRTD
ncbi:hypothetical protein [Jiangella alkaliphila]|uniref:Uncharacterized protein n=1 Tax=Jiangella alkaliphila TaxID=419479 RepID=A0A1H2IEH3_9ACTN|nr:hypothetical protein [Jiangella alkaliphila]SDU42559.1 hypothetical protein SAMN04488563_1656 [Jiangella alkaliphila]